MSLAKPLASLFRRDLSRLMDQIEAFPNDNSLWKTSHGIANSAGNLTLHIEGNLREYIGHQLGNLAYSRNRPLEFSLKGLPKEELIHRVTELQGSIPSIIENLSDAQIKMEYPEVVLDAAMHTGEFLLHLYGHLNWHRGQVDYLRRIIGEGNTAHHNRT